MLTLYLSLLDSEEEKSKFIQLYELYRNKMLYAAQKKLKDAHLAEDAVHNAFIKLTGYMNCVGEIDCHKTERFLVVITESVAMEMLRKDKHYPKESYEELEPFLAHREDALDRIAVQELMDLIAQLPEKYRVVLELRAYHGLEEKQIANLLEISYANARKRLERARGLLLQKLKEREEEMYAQ